MDKKELLKYHPSFEKQPCFITQYGFTAFTPEVIHETQLDKQKVKKVIEKNRKKHLEGKSEQDGEIDSNYVLDQILKELGLQ